MGPTLRRASCGWLLAFGEDQTVMVMSSLSSDTETFNKLC